MLWSADFPADDWDGFVLELPSGGGKPPWIQQIGALNQQQVQA